MTIYRTSEVFVPGGMPLLTYIPRIGLNLEERLRCAKDNLYKFTIVTGPTKSGKTVLVNQVFSPDKCVWVDGGTVREEEELWQYILEAIDGYTETLDQGSTEAGTIFSGELGGEGSIPLLVKGKCKAGIEYHKKTGDIKAKKLTLTPRIAAISQLQSTKLPLIIDDFHYLKREFQGNLIRALKPLIFKGHPVVLIAIPHRQYDAIKVEKEMTGRFESIRIPAWEKQELLSIAHEGFPLLNINVSHVILNRLAEEAYGSPHLMQEFCKRLSLSCNVTQTNDKTEYIREISNALFIDIAKGTGKVVFDKLAMGPRQGKDRIQRKLIDGTTNDIYRVTLFALARFQQSKPGLDSINYEELRSNIRKVLADKMPRAQELMKVLEKMAEIALSDEASTPVLDWEKEELKLHITDPFFAFYLKWGVKVPMKHSLVTIEVITNKPIEHRLRKVIEKTRVVIASSRIKSLFRDSKTIIIYRIIFDSQYQLEMLLNKIRHLKDVVSAKCI